MVQIRRIAGHIVLIFVMITAITNVCHCELESSSGTLIKEEETVTLWCATGNDEEKCNWESPTGERCIVVHQEFADKSRCVDGATAAWSTYGSGNCTITITSEALERNGDWKCSLNTALDDTGELSEGVVNLKIARSARVSMDPFGTLHLSEGANDTIECTAERGQPKGQFVWKIGEDKEDESAFVVHAIAETDFEEEDDGSFTATQRLMYIADMEHSGKKLHCIYEQRDDEGNNLFEGNQDDEDEVRIIVRYLEEPTEELETLPFAEEGQNYTITKEFMASPIPDSTKGEIIWEIGPLDGSDEPVRYQIPEITPTAIGKYIIEPLENAEEKHRYIARLTITDTNVYDQNDKYVLKIERKKDEDSEEIEEVKYEFQITVEPTLPNDEGVTDGGTLEASSPVGIIVAVIVILLLIIVIAVGLWYVRKEKKCCFAPAEQNVEKGKTRENATTEDQMTTQPLNYGGVPDEGDKTSRPIIKEEWSRPR